MNKEKTLALLLLDLAAFACTRTEDESARREFEAACGLVEKDAPFEAQVYRAHISKLSPKARDGNGWRGQRRSWPPRGHSTPAIPF